MSPEAATVVPDVLADHDLIGRFFDAFGTAQLRAEAAVAEPAPRLHHFLAGVVLYSGTHLVELGDRLYGVPLCCLWSA